MGPMIARRQGDQAKGFSRRCPPREARAAPGVDRPPVHRRGRAARRRGDGGRSAGRGGSSRRRVAWLHQGRRLHQHDSPRASQSAAQGPGPPRDAVHGHARRRPGLRHRGRPPGHGDGHRQGARRRDRLRHRAQRDPYRDGGLLSDDGGAARIDRALLQQRPDHLAALWRQDADPRHQSLQRGRTRGPGAAHRSRHGDIHRGRGQAATGREEGRVHPCRLGPRPSRRAHFSSGRAATRASGSPRSWKCWAGCSRAGSSAATCPP